MCASGTQPWSCSRWLLDAAADDDVDDDANINNNEDDDDDNEDGAAAADGVSVTPAAAACSSGGGGGSFWFSSVVRKHSGVCTVCSVQCTVYSARRERSCVVGVRRGRRRVGWCWAGA